MDTKETTRDDTLIDATLAFRPTTNWEADWVKANYLTAQEKEAAARETFRSAQYAFRRAAQEYASATRRTTDRFNEAIGSGMELPVVDREGKELCFEARAHTIESMLGELTRREAIRANIDTAVQASGKVDW